MSMASENIVQTSMVGLMCSCHGVCVSRINFRLNGSFLLPLNENSTVNFLHVITFRDSGCVIMSQVRMDCVDLTSGFFISLHIRSAKLISCKFMCSIAIKMLPLKKLPEIISEIIINSQLPTKCLAKIFN